MPARANVRIFTIPQPPTQQHSFLVGASQGGLTPVLASLPVQDQSTTFTDLRHRLEFQSDRSMNRRTLIFQELSFLLVAAPNPHGWGDDELMRYRFGFMREGEAVPRLVPAQKEDDVIMSVVNLYKHDLVLLPQSQVGPRCGRVCDGRACKRCPRVADRDGLDEPAMGAGLVPVTNEEFQRRQTTLARPSSPAAGGAGPSALASVEEVPEVPSAADDDEPEVSRPVPELAIFLKRAVVVAEASGGE